MIQIKIVFSLRMSLFGQLFPKDGNNTKCNKCSKDYKIVCASTSTLICHLRQVHNTIIDEAPSAKVTTGSMTKYI